MEMNKNEVVVLENEKRVEEEMRKTDYREPNLA